ncbi:MAG: SDR family oxidoreductase [Candidatus Omnitrophica bacterium]|nr:SDR family oxidoreductase [Candidatus Omnitrophota bacterium]
MKNRTLITGGTGLLGKALIETNRGAGISAVYIGDYSMQDGKRVTYYKADICKKDAMRAVFDKTKPKVVIHTAGIANVDYCERNYPEARDSNVNGTRVILDLCREYGSQIVFISTNAVFDGKHAPYSEDSAPCPINSYGRMKLEAEGIVRGSGLKHLIVRPILMYGWNNKHERSNTVTWLIEKLRKREKVNMVNDVYENPLFNRSCADIIWSLVDLGKEGLYHVAGKDVVNRFEFANLIAEVFYLDKSLINAVPGSYFTNLAPRPPDTSYDVGKVERELKIQLPRLKESLSLMRRTKE